MNRILGIFCFLLTVATLAPAQEWYFAWDGTTDIACTPCTDGSNPFFQSSAASPDSSWSIVNNGSGGKALRSADISTADVNDESLRWKGFGSRPEFYRGPCTSFAMENLHPDHNAFTLVFRIRCEDYQPGGSNPGKIKRIFNCEFETTIPNPYSSYPYYTFRVEFGLQRDTSGNIWLADFRYGDQLVMLRPAGGSAEWHTIWAMVEPPSSLDQADSIYRLWDDGSEIFWRDRDKGGWSDCDIGWDGGEEINRTATFELDYLCYGYEAWQPGDIAIPSESSPVAASTINEVELLDDGTPVELSDKIIVGVFNDPGSSGGKISTGKPLPPEIEENIALTRKYEPRFDPDVDMKFYYIAEPDGSGFIKVQHNTGLSPENSLGNPVNLHIGDRISLKGGVGSAECEKQIMAHEITRSDSGVTPPSPLLLDNEDIHLSYNQSLYEASPPQLLAASESGDVESLTSTSITDSARSWTSNKWQHLTAIIPERAGHPDFYYYVNNNTADTLNISSRVLPHETPIDIVADGVTTSDTFFFCGGRAGGTLYEGALLTTTGTVTAVNSTAGYFDIDDGAGPGDTRTIQDIWNTQEYSASFTPPDGVRVFFEGGLPTTGQQVEVTGCLGHYRFKLRQEPFWTSRDEVQIDKVMPVVWARNWILQSTPTPTSTATPTFTGTPAPTATATPTDTIVIPDTPTYTPTATASLTPTETESPVPTSTDTPTATQTDTPVPTLTETATATETQTPIPTSTNTATATVTDTPVPTFTDTPTPTETDTPVPTSTNTATATATDTPVPTHTGTPTPSATMTQTPAQTASMTPSPSGTPSETPAHTPLQTETPLDVPGWHMY